MPIITGVLGDSPLFKTKIGKIVQNIFPTCFVHPQGFEPWTPWLRVRCSTNWATGATFVVGKGIEPLCQDWESCILTVRWTDQLARILARNFEVKRKLGDSNPRYGNPHGSLANCWFQPLTQTSFPVCYRSIFSQMRCKGNAFLWDVQIFCGIFFKFSENSAFLAKNEGENIASAPSYEQWL